MKGQAAEFPPRELRLEEKVKAMKIANRVIGLTVLIGLAAVSVVAQTSSNSQSLGDYARQVRKSPDAAGKPKVFDNDNLPKTDKLSVVGNAAPAPATAEKAPEAKAAEPNKPAAPATEAKTAAAEAPKKAAGDETARQEAVKQWTDKIDAQKQQIDLQSRELDVMQREYQLRAAAMYADAGNRLRNQTDWDKQDADYKQKIADKQKAIDEAKQKLEDMQEQARKAGMPETVQQQ